MAIRMVESAFISGETPSLTAEKILMGSVVAEGPEVNDAITRSSSDSVNASSQPETTAGGTALKYYASVRLDIRRTGQIKEGTEVVGNETRVKVVKNKLAPPFRQAEFQILYNKGINRTGEIIDMGVERRILTRTGAWYSYADQRIGQGRKSVMQYFADNPDGLKEVEGKLLQVLMPKPVTKQAASAALTGKASA